jgi:FkbM family methyltransferase
VTATTPTRASGPIGSKTARLARRAPRLVLPARYWYRRLRGRADPELTVLEGLVRRGSIAVDVGANIGEYTYALARHAARVVAFEPLPECLALIRAARLPNVEIHPVALSSRAGSLPLHVPVAAELGEDTGKASFSRPEGAHRTVEVPVRTLDEMRLTNVSVIKIDVEGHEQPILEGARGTILRETPLLLIEIEQRHLANPIEEVLSAIEALGYAGYYLEGRGRFRSIATFSEAVHQRPYLSDDANPAYVNNFFFVHRDDPRRGVFTRSLLGGG